LLNPNTIAQVADFNGQCLHANCRDRPPATLFHASEPSWVEGTIPPFPDHHRFTPADLNYTDADAILMTEKDAVKCTTFANEKCWVLRVDAQLDSLLTQQILEKGYF